MPSEDELPVDVRQLAAEARVFATIAEGHTPADPEYDEVLSKAVGLIYLLADALDEAGEELRRARPAS